MIPQREEDSCGGDDSDLVRLVQAGDVEAFTPLVRRNLPLLRAFVALRLPVPNLADEITHETFVFAFRNMAAFDATKSFRAWLRGIAWNLIRAELQRFAREQVNLSRLEQVQLAEAYETSNQDSASDEAAFLEECLENLPQHLRRLVEERYHSGLSTEELSVALGRTGEWVRINLFRVRKQLRACIEGKVARSGHA